jgi:hypothetical protein
MAALPVPARLTSTETTPSRCPSSLWRAESLPSASACHALTTVSTEPVTTTSRCSSRDHATDHTLSACAACVHGRAEQDRCISARRVSHACCCHHGLAIPHLAVQLFNSSLSGKTEKWRWKMCFALRIVTRMAAWANLPSTESTTLNCSRAQGESAAIGRQDVRIFGVAVARCEQRRGGWLVYLR